MSRLIHIRTILAIYILFGVAYSLVSPIFESPDEFLHYQFVRYLIDRRELPVLTPGELSEYHQPPLYYALGALAAGGVPVEPYTPEQNPFWGYDLHRFGVDNKVRFVPTAADVFPYRGTALAAHLLRFMSVMLGALSVAIGYRALREVVVNRPALALGAAAIFACHPQFVFISASINNDNLATLAGALILLWSVRVAREGVTRRRAVMGGLWVALAALSKISAGVLVAVPVVALALAPGSRSNRLKALIVVGVVPLLATSGWFIRNLQLYGEPTAVNTMLETWGQRSIVEGLLHLEGQLTYIWTSFWGRFGIGQIVLPEWMYGLFALVGLAALAGLVRNVIGRRAEARGVIVLIAMVLSMLAGLIVFALINPGGSMGRYLFPSLAAIAGLLFFGLRGLYRPDAARADGYCVGATFVSMIAFNLVVLLGVIAPAYALPEAVSLDQVRRATQPADIRFGEAGVLLGYAIDQDRVAPGDELRVELCWQVLQPTRSNAYIFIHLLGPENAIVGRRETYPGLGRYPTVNWRAGHIFCDDIPLRVEAWAPAPAVYDVEVGLTDAATRARLNAISADGVPLSPVVLARVKVRSAPSPQVEVTKRFNANFGGEIELLDATIAPAAIHPGDSLSVELRWRAVRVPADNYTVFVHLRDATGAIAAQGDSQPQTGRYPTRFWDAGEIVADIHPIDLPGSIAPERYTISVGLYVLETGARLPLQGAAESAVTIGTIEVTR